MKQGLVVTHSSKPQMTSVPHDMKISKLVDVKCIHRENTYINAAIIKKTFLPLLINNNGDYFMIRLLIR